MAKRKKRLDSIPREMSEHLRCLGIASLTDYRAWCRSNNYSVTLNKNERQRRQELDCHRKQLALIKLTMHKKERNSRSMVERVYHQKNGQDRKSVV